MIGIKLDHASSEGIKKYEFAVAKPARQFSHAMQIFLCLYTIKGINF